MDTYEQVAFVCQYHIRPESEPPSKATRDERCELLMADILAIIFPEKTEEELEEDAKAYFTEYGAGKEGKKKPPPKW